MNVTTVDQTVASVNGSQANGERIWIGGRDFSVQTIVPASLGIIEISNDGTNWVSEAATLGSAVTAVTKKPLWARPAVASDVGAVRNFVFRFAIVVTEGD